MSKGLFEADISIFVHSIPQLLLNCRINDIKGDNSVNMENEVAKSFFYSFFDKLDNGMISITNWNQACLAKLGPRGLQEVIKPPFK